MHRRYTTTWGLTGIDLPIEVLFGRRDPRITQIHDDSVPKVGSVQLKRDCTFDPTYGTGIADANLDLTLLRPTVPLPKKWDGRPQPVNPLITSSSAGPTTPIERQDLDAAV